MFCWRASPKFSQRFRLALTSLFLVSACSDIAIFLASVGAKSTSPYGLESSWEIVGSTQNLLFCGVVGWWATVFLLFEESKIRQMLRSVIWGVGTRYLNFKSCFAQNQSSWTYLGNCKCFLHSGYGQAWWEREKKANWFLGASYSPSQLCRGKGIWQWRNTTSQSPW